MRFGTICPRQTKSFPQCHLQGLTIWLNETHIACHRNCKAALLQHLPLCFPQTHRRNFPLTSMRAQPKLVSTTQVDNSISTSSTDYKVGHLLE
jgi:hypothetical protein